MGGDPSPAGPGDPSVEGFGGLVVGQFEDDAQAFFEVVGASEPRVGLHDPGELHLLLLGEIFAGSSSYADIGIIQQRITGVPAARALSWRAGVAPPRTLRPTQTSRPESWSTTQVQYLGPRL